MDKGSHGTTATRAISIQKYGWRTGTGRAGTGIYFWKECDHFIELAVGWYKRELAEKKYKNDNQQECKVIVADFEANDDEVLDLDNRELKNKVYKLAKEKKMSYSNNREIAKVYNLFITELEGEMKTNFKVITMEVSPPGSEYCDYPSPLLGPPICYSVRHAGCINIIDIMTCPR